MSSKCAKNYKLTNEGHFSITRPYESNQIIRFIEKIITKNKFSISVITDATAGMGGDSIAFSKKVRFVNSVEIDSNNFECLKENIKSFDCQNVELYKSDYMCLMKKLKQDIIYFDPPWGGTDYKNKEMINLCLNDIPLYKIIQEIKLYKLAKSIFIKVPINACLENIDYSLMQTIYNRNKKISFNIIYINIE